MNKLAAVIIVYLLCMIAIGVFAILGAVQNTGAAMMTLTDDTWVIRQAVRVLAKEKGATVAAPSDASE